MFELLFTHPLWAWRTGTLAFASTWPRWLLVACIAAGAIAIVLGLYRRRSLGAFKLVAIGVLQLAVVSLIACLIWRPVLIVERVRDRENVLAIALDASASMAYEDTVDSSRSRLQQSVSALQGKALADLQRTFEVRLFSFASRTESIPTPEAVPAPGAQTRVGDALTQLLQTAGTLPLAGVVVISDGAENGDTLTEERLAHIASYGVPVHTVGVGPEQLPNDLELSALDVAAMAPGGSTVSAQVQVRHDAAATTRLRIYDGERLLAARDLDLRGTGPVSTFSVDFPAGEPGTHDLRFALDAVKGETDLINNARTTVLHVPANRRRILYVEGEPRWEYKFLRRALEGERSIHLTSVVRTTPNKFFRQGVNSGAELINGFPEDVRELFAYDAVIIGSFEAASLTTQQHEWLRDFVDKRGGSVLLLAGRSGLSEGGWESTLLSQALPTHLPSRQAGAVQRSTPVRLTQYASDAPVTRFDLDPRRSAEMWRTLPPLADLQPLGRLKPGATVLLESDTDRSSPVLVWQRYGQGATFLLATSTTLRWQMRSDPSDQRHELFWRQLAHALTDAAPLRTRLRSERTVYNDQDEIRLEAQLRNARFEPITDARVELFVAPEKNASFSASMRPSDAGDGRYLASIEGTSAGLYRIDMTAHLPDGEVQTATTYVRRSDGVLEHYGIRQNRPLLERIASSTGGRYWKLDEIDQLAAAIPYSKAGIVERQMLDLWNLPIVFLVLLGLKLGEWLLRLRWGRL
ncbi:MAG: hypothetical protein ACJ8OJ_13545 [Povalibacter sp.]